MSGGFLCIVRRASYPPAREGHIDLDALYIFHIHPATAGGFSRGLCRMIFGEGRQGYNRWSST